MNVIIDNFGLCRFGRAIQNSAMKPCPLAAEVWVHDLDDDTHPGWRSCTMHARFFQQVLTNRQLQWIKEQELAAKIEAKLRLELREEDDGQATDEGDGEVPSDG